MSQLYLTKYSPDISIDQYKNGNIIEKEFWTSKQRQSSSLHEVPYRACFKAEIPNYFIKNFTSERDIIYDPFAGRGTTGIEAALLNRIPILNDINPISKNISNPRLSIPKIELIKKRLEQIFNNTKIENFKPELEMFFHFDTEKELVILKEHFKKIFQFIHSFSFLMGCLFYLAYPIFFLH